jgi:hypothetical protein
MTGELVPRRQPLPPLDLAKALIERAVIEEDVPYLLDLRAQARAINQLLRDRGDAKDRADDAGEIKVRAERGIGQIDRAKRPHGTNRYTGRVSGTGNSTDRIRAETRADWRNRLAPVSNGRFDELIELAKADEHAGVSTARLIQIIRFGSTMSSTTFECHTPAAYIEAAVEVLGGIDLDPASSADANQTVGAAEFFDEDIDGLTRDWHGRVWLNPPYGRSLTSRFVTKLVDEFDAGRVSAAITVVNAYGFDARWFQPLFRHLLCFTDHRIQFYGGGPTFGSLFAYLGPGRRRFARVFAQFGTIVKRWP